MPRQVYELQQEFGGADFLTASRLFVKEGDLIKVKRRAWIGVPIIVDAGTVAPCALRSNLFYCFCRARWDLSFCLPLFGLSCTLAGVACESRWPGGLLLLFPLRRGPLHVLRITLLLRLDYVLRSKSLRFR